MLSLVVCLTSLNLPLPLCSLSAVLSDLNFITNVSLCDHLQLIYIKENCVPLTLPVLSHCACVRVSDCITGVRVVMNYLSALMTDLWHTSPSHRPSWVIDYQMLRRWALSSTLCSTSVVIYLSPGNVLHVLIFEVLLNPKCRWPKCPVDCL